MTKETTSRTCELCGGQMLVYSSNRKTGRQYARCKACGKTARFELQTAEAMGSAVGDLLISVKKLYNDIERLSKNLTEKGTPKT